MTRQEDGLALCVRCCPFTSGVSRTGDESARDCCRRMVKTNLNQILFHRLDEVVRHIGDDQILPDGQPNFPRAVVLCDVSNPAHLLRRHPAHSNNYRKKVGPGKMFQRDRLAGCSFWTLRFAAYRHQVRLLVKSISYYDHWVSSAEASCTARSITSWAEGMS